MRRDEIHLGNEVLAHIEYSIDLMASTSLYHKCCSIEFRLEKYPEKDCYEPFSKNSKKTVAGQMFDIKEKMPFCKL